MSSEQDVDRELKAALSVSPSPEFETRVRQRIERDRPSGWTARHAWLAAAASVVLVAGLFSLVNRPTSGVEEPATPPVVAGTEPRSAPVAPVTPAATKQIERPHVARVRPAASAARNTEPEVLVPVNQMEAVRRLVDALDEGRIALPAASEGPVEPPAEVVVAPIVVEPLPVLGLEPGGGAPSPHIQRLQ